jgi:hypothetical protein
MAVGIMSDNELDELDGGSSETEDTACVLLLLFKRLELADVPSSKSLGSTGAPVVVIITEDEEVMTFSSSSALDDEVVTNVAAFP